MLLIHQELARARGRDLREEARAEAIVSRVVTARRWQRKADTAGRRARASAAALE